MQNGSENVQNGHEKCRMVLKCAKGGELCTLVGGGLCTFGMEMCTFDGVLCTFGGELCIFDGELCTFDGEPCRLGPKGSVEDRRGDTAK